MKTDKEKEFLELIREHEGLINKVCQFYSNDMPSRQDLFQEIVIQLWKSHESFRNESKVSTWMYRVALNTALTEKRRRKTRVSLSFIDSLNEGKADINDSCDDDENIRVMYSAISKLTEIEKAIVMFYLDDKTYEEMEEILGINQGNLRVKMNRIKEKLRQITKAN